MSERRKSVGTHAGEELLLQVALGQAEPPVGQQVAAHLAVCPSCRRVYDDLAGAVELVLPAVPRVAPPPSFEAAVLARLADARQGAATPAARTVPGGVSRRTLLWAAAAGAAGLAAGGGITAYLGREPGPEWATPLVTVDGETVGLVSPSYGADGPVLVVDVSDGPVGERLTCRVRLADGTTTEVGRWSLSADRPNSWVVEVGGRQVETLEMVLADGSTWATARP